MMRACGLIPGLAAVLLANSAVAADWKIDSETSALDGMKTVTASLDSDNEIPNSIGRPERATLIVRCQQRRLEAFVYWPGFIGIDSVDGLYRVGEGAIRPIRLHSSTGGSATFIPPREVGRVLNELTAGGQLVMRITPDRYAPQEATWSLGDAWPAISQAMSACG